jgi:nitroreductase
MKKDLQRIVYYATQAPSSHNTQPWKFLVEDDRILIFPDYTRALTIADADQHELFISLGCALENLMIAARQMNYAPSATIHTEGEIYIEVNLTALAQSKDDRLFDQIVVRQTTRNKYNGKPIPENYLEVLRSSAMRDDVKCKFFTDYDEIGTVIELVKEACIRQYSDEAFVDEMLQWVRFNESGAVKTLDGINSASSGKPSVPGWLGKFILGSTSPKKQADQIEELIRSSSALVFFIGKRNDVKAWINLGRSFERFALTATSLNISHAHINMPCEVPSVRQKLAHLMDLNHDEAPLLLIRIGYSEKMPYSYRRPVEQVVELRQQD